ncbi:alpha/beta hydrolase family protein [Pendulispora brunnea]|uniref:Alpha/beta hydrolase family protein n=1 Tax=Pendulispora brunnea TaxID=2905690 RepID=A0ABZ2JY13_9BACT
MIDIAWKLSRKPADDTVINGHIVDRLYARFGRRRAGLFAHGWGDDAVLARLTSAEVFRPSPVKLAITWEGDAGHFESPLAHALPEAVRTARVRRVGSTGSKRRTACVLLAGSREEGFALRESIYGPLTADGIDLVLLENPFYGLRRPPGQDGANLRTVAEHALMNIAIVAEAHALLEALRAEGYERLGIAGYSMGGYMAALTAVFTEAPLAVAALAAGSSPAPVFTRGGLSHSIDFARLGASMLDDAAARKKLFALFDMARITQWPAPVHAESTILLACRRDGYVPASETRALHAHWPKSVLRWVDAGHISALFTERRALRAAVRDAFARLPNDTRSTAT